jgi:DNA-binding NarL/FixJ family response regulator
MKKPARKKAGPSKTRVLVVDDHPLFRSGLVDLVNRQPNLTCCGEVDSAAKALESLRQKEPDLILLDLRLGQDDGLELIKALKVQRPASAILVISQYDETLYAQRALRAGASGYLMKEEATDEVLTAIHAVLAGELYVSRTMSVLLLRKSLEERPGSARTGVQSLTDRELQVFQMLGAGMGTRQIAESFHLSVKTIETYRQNIKNKLQLPDAAALVRQARQYVGNAHTPAPPT